MIDEICAEIRNYFTYDSDKHFGTFHIENGQIVPSLGFFPTDYIRIIGSHLNDGVHKVSDNDLTDEGDFYGAVWIMSPPNSFIRLCDEIALWQEKNGSADSVAMSPFSSESFGGYSYTKSAGNTVEGTSGISWAKVYSERLKQYRRIRV